MNFTFPYCTLIWAITIIAIIFIIFMLRKSRRDLLKLASVPALNIISPYLSPKRKTMKTVFLIIGLSALTFSICGPQWGREEVYEKVLGTEIFIALDASQSMMAQDNPPSRLEYSKSLLKKIAEKLSGNKMGVIAFAGTAYVECPLTTDTDAVNLFIDYIDYTSIPVQGTNIADAIKLAHESFNKNTKNPKSLIILSDGENLSGNALEESKKAAKDNITIYTIGIGTPSGVVLKINGETKLDESGRPVISKLDEQMLKEIARLTGGLYVGQNQENGINEIASSIKKMEKEQMMENKNIKMIERFQIPLALGFLFLCIEPLIPDRRQKNR